MAHLVQGAFLDQWPHIRVICELSCKRYRRPVIFTQLVRPINVIWGDDCYQVFNKNNTADEFTVTITITQLMRAVFPINVIWVVVNCPTSWFIDHLDFTTQITEKYSRAMCYIAPSDTPVFQKNHIFLNELAGILFEWIFFALNETIWQKKIIYFWINFVPKQIEWMI